jgi:hypothetical protein
MPSPANEKKPSPADQEYISSVAAIIKPGSQRPEQFQSALTGLGELVVTSLGLEPAKRQRTVLLFDKPRTEIRLAITSSGKSEPEAAAIADRIVNIYAALAEVSLASAVGTEKFQAALSRRPIDGKAM